jgi:serine/threonine protein kinase
MNHKIACPSCQHNLSIKDPKPGKYKPKCSGCGNPFVVVVEAGDPPKITVGDSLPKVSGFEETVPPSAADSSEVTLPGNVTLPPSGPSSKSSLSKSSGDSKSAGQSKPSGVEQTMELPSGKGSSRDFSVNQQTMDSTPSQQSASISSADASGAIGKSTGINRLGGYRILKELGAGGMGSVYLAKQISLDRSCALKTIQAKWAQNPRVIARFIREAYAAAQLTHHNVVQIYDLGVDGNTNFFSMELVSGGSLDDHLKTKGKLQPKLAAMLILQASRGLKFAHDHGMVHRDIKPANLMLTSDGMVKVADMGLVKTTSADELPEADDTDVQSMVLASARSQVTAIGSSMGTPAYMSPEQSLDATNVDKRADIYSLGCTFYALLTGKPPFDGNTMMEVITKHRVETIVRPERIISGLPIILGDIIEKMTAKSPDDRYQDLEELIHDLEIYLELREDTSKAKIQHHPGDVDELASSREKGTGGADVSNHKSANIALVLSPEQVGLLQIATKRFNSSPLLLVRRFAPMAWFGLCGLMCVLSLLFSVMAGLSLVGEGAKSVASQASSAVQGLGGADASAAVVANAQPVVSKASQYLASMVSQFKTAIGYGLAMFVAVIAAIALAGFERRSPLAQRWRASFLAGGIAEWIYWIFGGLVALLAAYFLGLWFPIILGTIFGGIAGAAFYFGLEKTLAKTRQPSIDQAQTLLKQLRLRGADEANIRQAIADSAGANWEEFYETLFGYDTMRAMRTRLQQSKQTGLQVFRPRRDKLIDQWEQKLTDTRRQNDEKILGKAEKAELVANGVSESEAAKRSIAMAASMVDAASETRQTMLDIAAGKLTDQAAMAKRLRIKQMMSEARTGKLSGRVVRSRALETMLGQWLGSKLRFVCGAVLLLASGMWIQANQKEVESNWQQAKSTAKSTLESLKNTTLDSSGLENATQALSTVTEQAKTAIVKSESKAWNRVWGGLVTEKNILFVALAGVLLLGSLFFSGWKITLLAIPIAALLCAVPLFM